MGNTREIILWAALILSISAFPVSRSSVFSVDLGSEWMKVAVVQLKPGQSPISVAINEMSKRKSPALVAFHKGDRLIAEEAAGISGRYPDKVFAQARDMIGKPFEHAKSLVESLYLPYDIVEDSRGSPGIRTDDGKVYSAEELVAMVLGYAKSLAELHAKIPIKDAVISVPPFFGQAQRTGILQAAQLAGINVLSLVNEHSGAAIQYGFDKDFSNASRHVVFYDMGASSVYAALVYFSSYTAKEFGKNVSVNQFQVKDVKWNTRIGGQSFEMRLVDHFADQFNKQLGTGVDVRKFPKAMAKLKKQVKRTKEILSANTEAPLSVESLYDDQDFRSTITRHKYEGLCADLFEEALVPVKEALQSSALSIEDVYAVELIGGATRTPKLQAVLQDFLGRKGLDKHLDADEAIVLGSALHAANLSDGIKLNRKLGMIDGAMYGIFLEIKNPDLKDEPTKQLLVPRMKKLPSKAFRSVTFTKDFEVTLHYDHQDILPPGIISSEIATFQVSGLTDTYTKYASRNLSSPIKTNIHFSSSRSGVVSFDRAETVIEVSEWIDVPVKNLTIGNSASTDENITTSNDNKTNQATKSSGDSKPNVTSSTENEEQPTKIVTEKKLRKRTFRVPLKIVDITKGPGSPLTKEAISEAESRLVELERKDAERKRTAELKNSLEEYIYSMKEKLESTDGIEKVSTEEERNSFSQKLDEVQEWLYTDGEDASADDFEKHLNSLKSIGEEIFFRWNELSARPAACNFAKEFVSGVQKTVDDWDNTKPWIPQTLKEELLNESNALRGWLQEKEGRQAKTPAHVAPIFSSEEVYERVEKLQRKVTKIGKTPKPKPKPQASSQADKAESKNETSRSTNGEQSDNSNEEKANEESKSESQNSADESNSEEPFDEL